MKTIRFGQQVEELALMHADKINRLAFIRRLRAGKVTLEEYRGFIAVLYPVVFTFTKALAMVMGKFDPVIHLVVVAGLARQLREELEHNSMWRTMLSSHLIDYGLIHSDYLKMDLSAPFPSSIHALNQRMLQTADMETPLPHFCCQFAMETVILRVVSKSIYPGVLKNESLGTKGLASIDWWDAHTEKGEGGEESDEVRHLRLARTMIDLGVHDKPLRQAILPEVEVTMNKFVEAIRFFNGNSFPITRYLKK